MPKESCLSECGKYPTQCFPFMSEGICPVEAARLGKYKKYRIYVGKDPVPRVRTDDAVRARKVIWYLTGLGYTVKIGTEDEEFLPSLIGQEAAEEQYAKAAQAILAHGDQEKWLTVEEGKYG